MTDFEAARAAHPDGRIRYLLTDDYFGPPMLCRVGLWTDADGVEQGDHGPVDELLLGRGEWIRGTTSTLEAPGRTLTLDKIVGYPGDDLWAAWWPATVISEDQARAWAAERSITID